MTSLFRRLQWWLRRRRKEDELRAELQFHLDEEMDDRRAQGLSAQAAAVAARRDLGNAALVREDARALWSWVLLEQLAQDVRYALRGMRKNRMFTALAALSLALGMGANTAIYSFMDAILLRSLPVSDPESLVVLKWRSRPLTSAGRQFVMHSVEGSTYDDASGQTAGIFPLAALEHLRTAATPVSGAVQSVRAQAGRAPPRGDERRSGGRARGVRLRGLLRGSGRSAGGGAPHPT
jgi:macrolide transport system ATP-binding/permease protein